MMRTCFLCAAAGWAVLICGCSGGGDKSVPSGLTILVQYQQQPLSDVHVILHEQVGGPLVMEGWTGIDGIAELRIPSVSEFSRLEDVTEVMEFIVVADSISGGGWIIQPKYADLSHGELKVAFEVGQDQAMLELPGDAVKVL